MTPSKPIPPHRQYRLWPLVLWFMVFGFVPAARSTGTAEIPYTSFKQQAARGEIAGITMRGNRITAVIEPSQAVDPTASTRRAQRFSTTIPAGGDPGLIPLLEKHHVNILAEPDDTPWLATLLLQVLPWIVLIGLFLALGPRMSRHVGRASEGLFDFAKSRAKRYERASSHVRFQDVAGATHAKRDLQEIVDYLRDPARYTTLGGRWPRGILLVGPPLLWMAARCAHTSRRRAPKKIRGAVMPVAVGQAGAAGL